MTAADGVLIILEAAFALGLYLLAGYAVKSLSPKWRLCYIIPLVIACLETALFGFEISLLPAYLGAVILLAGFIWEKEKTRKAASVMAGAAVLLSAAVCMVNPGYRAKDYTADFKHGFEEIKTHYVLTEQKGIDWDRLYKKYLPQFEQADKNHDEMESFLAWHSFAMEFHDGHVTYNPSSQEAIGLIEERICGNDYGLSLMKLENGQTVAVNVEEDSAIFRAGIRNGTVITGWDKRPVDAMAAEADKQMVKICNFACKENEDFYLPLMAAGTGGDSVCISFVDDNGKECEVTADKMGSYARRMKESMEILDQGVEISNLGWKELDDHTALLRMRFMMYDAQENFSQMEEEIRAKLLELKAAGVTGLVLDLRGNGGGSGSYVKHIIKLLAPKGEHVYAYDGVFDTETLSYKKNADGTWQTGECERYEGEDLWGHGEILILVNAQTISAGDHFTRLASEFPNVTIMGFTHTNCSGQGINTVSFDYGTFSYSAVLLLEEDGSVYIDTDEGKTPTVPLDVRIPFDEKAVEALFEKREDYVLDYALEYWKK